MKRLLAVLILLLSLGVPTVQADSVLKITIYDETAGFIDVTAHPMAFVSGHTYFITANQQGTNHPNKITLDMGASTTYWTISGNGCSFGGSGNGSGSLSGTVQTCTSGTNSWVGSATFEVTAHPIIVASLIGRSTHPTGNDTISYSTS